MLALWSLLATVVFATAAVVMDPAAGPALGLVGFLGWLVSLSLTLPVQGRRRYADVAFLAGVVWFLTFGLRTLMLLARSQPELPGVPTDPAILAGFLPVHLEALLLAVVSWAAFVIGYRASPGRSIASKLPDTQRDRLSAGRLGALVVLFAMVGWAARVRFRAIHNTFDVLNPESLGADDTLLTWLAVLATAALVLALLGLALHPRNAAFAGLAALLATAEVGFALYTGIRAPIFAVALAVIAFAPMRIRLPRRAVLVGVPAILLLFGATVVYRNPEVFSQAGTDTAAQRFETTLERSAELGPVGLAEIALWNLSARYIGTDSVGQVLLVGPMADAGAERYVLAIPSALIPRFLWPDKPTTSIALEFARTYHGVGQDQDVPFAPTWVGDFLLSFPPPIVPVCLLVMGFLLRVLNDYGRRAQASRSLGFLPYALILPIAIQSDGWVSFGLYQVTQIVAVTIGIAIVLHLGSPVRQAVPAPPPRAAVTG